MSRLSKNPDPLRIGKGRKSVLDNGVFRRGAASCRAGEWVKLKDFHNIYAIWSRV
jgi:hypothetical protein